MTKLLIRLFKGPIKRLILKNIISEDIQKQIVDYANANIDIPKLTEEDEEQLLHGILDSAVIAATKAIDRI